MAVFCPKCGERHETIATCGRCGYELAKRLDVHHAARGRSPKRFGFGAAVAVLLMGLTLLLVVGLFGVRSGATSVAPVVRSVPAEASPLEHRVERHGNDGR